MSKSDHSLIPVHTDSFDLSCSNKLH